MPAKISEQEASRAQIAGLPHLVAETVIPKELFLSRRELPTPKKIHSFIIRRDVWPENKAAFDRHEMVEFCLGHRIFADKDKRFVKRRLRIPGSGIKLVDGGIELVAGWRAHARAKPLNGYFDGVLKLILVLGVAGKHTVGHPIYVAADWEDGWGTWLFREHRGNLGGLLRNFINSRIAEPIREKVAPAIDAEIEKWLGKLGLSRKHLSRVTASMVGTGLRIRLFDRPVTVRLVGFKTIEATVMKDPRWPPGEDRQSLLTESILHEAANYVGYRTVIQTSRVARVPDLRKVGSRSMAAYSLPKGETLAEALTLRDLTLFQGIVRGPKDAGFNDVPGYLRVWGFRKNEADGRYYSGMAFQLRGRVPIALIRDDSAKRQGRIRRAPRSTRRSPSST